MKIFNYILFVVSIVGITTALILCIMGNQPCSGDGCLIHVLNIIALIVFVPSAIVCYFSWRNIKSYKVEKFLK